MRIFSEESKDVLEAVAALNYTNPFTPERIELEKIILGAEYINYGEVWSERSNHRGMDNLNKIRGKVHDLAKSAIEKRSSGICPDKDELFSYEGLMVYHLYEKYRNWIREIIIARSEPEKIEFYHEFAKDVDMLFNLPGKIKLPSGYNAPHLLAMFYQIQRAFYHIFEFLTGGSSASAKLRASIWESIFTHDIYRYQRSLFRRMNDITTLITGPSGTGKELVARAVAYCAYIPFLPREKRFAADYRRQFIALHLAAMPSNLIESELFGHRKGAYTGALSDNVGWFEQVSEYGTVFLDEIGEIDERIQVKLLRLLQTGTFQRLGDSTVRHFKGRIIAATNRDLSLEIAEGRFRHDLYYRLCSDRIETPSLKEQIAGKRGELESFVNFISLRVAGDEESANLAKESVKWIIRNLTLDYQWSGNVRELEQCVRNIMIRGSYSPLEVKKQQAGNLAEKITNFELSADELISEYCRMIYRTNRSYRETAEILQLDWRTVKARLKI